MCETPLELSYEISLFGLLAGILSYKAVYLDMMAHGFIVSQSHPPQKTDEDMFVTGKRMGPSRPLVVGLGKGEVIGWFTTITVFRPNHDTLQLVGLQAASQSSLVSFRLPASAVPPMPEPTGDETSFPLLPTFGLSDLLVVIHHQIPN